MKTPEDEAFEDIERRQGGFHAKRQAAMDKINSEFDEEYIKYRTAFPKNYTFPAQEQNTITFSTSSDWVMRITADRRIEVNEGVEVTEAAKKVLEAMQWMLKPTQEREALKLALEALEKIAYVTAMDYEYQRWARKSIPAIKETLAQPAQEPVAWITPDGEGFRIRFSPPTNDVPLGWDALYTKLPKREWVGLTDEDRKAVLLTAYKEWECEEFLLCAREDYLLIEQALKEKNT
jgi:hypothetical protein